MMRIILALYKRYIFHQNRSSKINTKIIIQFLICLKASIGRQITVHGFCALRSCLNGISAKHPIKYRIRLCRTGSHVRSQHIFCHCYCSLNKRNQILASGLCLIV